jgi:hypothetical protein
LIRAAVPIEIGNTGSMAKNAAIKRPVAFTKFHMSLITIVLLLREESPVYAGEYGG